MLIGLDIGTSSSKGVAIDDRGRVVASASESYDFERPRAGWSEHDPAGWWVAARAVVARLVRDVGPLEIRGLGVSGQMHGSVFLDRESVERAGSEEVRAIRPALMWNDQRTGAQCERLADRLGGVGSVIRLVGNAPRTGFTLPKVMWLRDEEPDAFARLARVINPKDFVVLQMTGACSTDVGDASGVLAFDVASRSWSREVLDAVGLDPSLMPEVLESGAVAGRVTSWASEQTGVPEGVPVVAGSGDNQCGAIGAGIARVGLMLATLGTSGVIYAHADEPRLDLPLGRVHTMCSATGDGHARGGWCNTGCTLSAAGALRWAHEMIGGGASMEELLEEASRVPPGCEGLVFAPHLTGERCPYPDPRASGAWVGLTLRHTRGHLVRAVLEGVTFTMASILDIVRSLPTEVSEIRLGGGGNRSALWRQMQADVYGQPVSVLNAEEGPAYGAALLAGVGVGAWGSVSEACDATIRVVETIDPSAVAPRYEEAKRVHAGLYAHLRDDMHALARARTGE